MLAPPVEPGDVAQSTRTPVASTPSRLEPGHTFRDCPHCPEMVVLPAGRFRMGSPDSEPNRNSSEGPVRTVTMSQPFAMGKTEVTQANGGR
jgi:formylglycine-generating enzyme required for sulfatase activity